MKYWDLKPEPRTKLDDWEQWTNWTWTKLLKRSYSKKIIHVTEG